MRLSQTYKEIFPRAFQSLLGVQSAVNESSLSPRLRCLVALRASQINGCSFCLGYHLQEAEQLGLSTVELTVLPGWRDAGLYDERTCAALAWCEALTRLDTPAPWDDLYDHVREVFSEREISELSLAIAAINAWNRMNVGFAVAPPQAPAR